MTSEAITRVAPALVLEAARDFFTGTARLADAWIESESDTHVAFGTFRGNLAVAAFPDPMDPSRTRIRVTTLREEGLVPRLMTSFEELDRRAGAPPDHDRSAGTATPAVAAPVTRGDGTRTS